MSIALCVLPLSEPYKKQLETLVPGDLEYMPLSAVKPKGAVAALRYLFAQRTDAVYIVFEEPQEMIMQPIISLISLCIRTRRRFIVRPGKPPVPLRVSDFARALCDLVVGSAAAVWSGIVAYVELGRMERDNRGAGAIVPDSRIIYLNTNVNLGVKAGGSLGHVAGVVNDLFRRGFDVTYAATRRFSVIDAAIPMHTLSLPRALGMPMDLFIFGFSQHIYRQLKPPISAHGPTVIYQRMSRSDYTGAKLAMRLGVPLILEYNGSEAWGARHWGHPMVFERLARRAELVSIRSAHTVVTISEVLADELRELGVPDSRIVVYPNCVDSDVFDSARFDRADNTALRRRHGLPDGAIVLGFIGTFGKWHGVDVLCAAIRRLVQEHRNWLDRHCVRFLIVGDGFHGRYVAELVADEAVRGYVSWPGLVEQREGPAYLAAMDILLSPHVPNEDGSRFFGSPTKLFEYMSMGRAIVASRLDQIGEVLAPGLDAAALPDASPADATPEHAVLAEPGNIDELMSAIRFLVERPEWRTALAQNARARVLTRYQWSHHVGHILERTGLESPAAVSP